MLAAIALFIQWSDKASSKASVAGRFPERFLAAVGPQDALRNIFSGLQVENDTIAPE
jgi:hypothetical protein